jgi:hypothetical protein
MRTQTLANCTENWHEELVVVALYMLADEAQVVRQRAGSLLRFMLHVAAGDAADCFDSDWNESLSETTGCGLMSVQRVNALLLASAEAAAKQAALTCHAMFVASCVRVLVGRCLQSSWRPQQQKLLALMRPLLAQTHLSAHGDAEGRQLVARLLHLTRQVSASGLAAEAPALWTAVASHSASNVATSMDCLLAITQQLLSCTPHPPPGATSDAAQQALAAVELAARGLLRGARAASIALLCALIRAGPATPATPAAPLATHGARSACSGEAAEVDVSPSVLLSLLALLV